MLTHIWGLMSPDVGRTENQKHKQYKLVLKSSELDPSLLPRLLCFRSSQCWAAPVGAPSVAREWLWGPTSGCTAAQHPAHLLQLFAFGAGGWKAPCFGWRAVLARALWAHFTSRGFGSAKGIQVLSLSRQAGGGFGVRELENQLVHILVTIFITCRTCPENQSCGSLPWLRGIT